MSNGGGTFAVQTLQLCANGGPTRFQFNGTISAFMYGIGSFALTTTPSEIQHIGLSVQPQGGGVGSSYVDLQLLVAIDSPNNSPVQNNSAWVTVVATIGGSTLDGVTLQNFAKLPVGGATGGEPPGSIPSVVSPPLVSIAAIAGFDLTFAANADIPTEIGVAVGLNVTSFGAATTVTPIAAATLQGCVASGDPSGNYPQIGPCSVDVGVLVSTQIYNDLGFAYGTQASTWSLPWTPLSGGGYPTNLQANALLQSFFAGFSSAPSFSSGQVANSLLIGNPQTTGNGWVSVSSNGSSIAWKIVSRPSLSLTPSGGTTSENDQYAFGVWGIASAAAS